MGLAVYIKSNNNIQLSFRNHFHPVYKHFLDIDKCEFNIFRECKNGPYKKEFDCYSLACVLIALLIPKEILKNVLERIYTTPFDTNLIKPEFKPTHNQLAKIKKYIGDSTIGGHSNTLQITIEGIALQD